MIPVSSDFHALPVWILGAVRRRRVWTTPEPKAEARSELEICQEIIGVSDREVNASNDAKRTTQNQIGYLAGAVEQERTNSGGQRCSSLGDKTI